jgi:hypothetical protein
MTKTEDNPMHLKPREPSRLRQAPRCLARTRRGTPCQSPAVAGKTRCRMHRGAAGSGAPKGKRNGKYRHGQQDSNGNLAVKLLRTFAAQTEALQRYRGKGQQKVPSSTCTSTPAGRPCSVWLRPRGEGFSRNRRIKPMQGISVGGEEEAA